MITTDILVSIAVQIPFVVIMIWFTLELLSRTDKSVSKRDSEWREFLKESQKTSSDAYLSVAGELKILTKCIVDQGTLLGTHDTRVGDLADRVDGFLETYQVDKKVKELSLSRTHRKEE